MTATPVALDYQGVAAFLIDASVYPGSSGSPVFLLDKGTYQTRDGATVVGSRFYLLGVLAAVHAQNIDAEVVQAAGPLIARFQQALGLGIVFRVSALDDCVDIALTNAGLTRVPSGTPIPASPKSTSADEQVAEGTAEGTS